MMRSWMTRLLAGAAVLFVTTAPSTAESAVPLDVEPPSATVETGNGPPCKGSIYGCWPLTGGSCIVRYGKDCEKMKRYENECNLDHPDCGLGGATPT